MASFDEELSYGFRKLTLSGHRNRNRRRKPKTQQVFRILPEPVLITPDHGTLKCLSSQTLNFSKLIKYVKLNRRSYEFADIEDNFPLSFHVNKIFRVENPFIELSFNLKRHFVYNDEVPKRLYHGTKEKNIDGICMENFDWRLSGSETGHRYGKGVNFAVKPKFALNFCNKRKLVKVIIIADVLIKHVAVGNENTLVAPRDYDTTCRENGSTFVKFYDSEFCPKYVVYVVKK